MTTLLWLKQAVKLLVLPPNGPLLLVVIGIAIAGHRPRRGRQLALLGVVVLVLLSMPAVGGWLTMALGRTSPLDLAQVSNAQAIVILGGGVRREAPEYGGATLGGITLERVRYGARLARTTGLPVLVSGGAVDDVPAEARLMRKAFVDEYGVAVRWSEVRSHNTHENAVNSAALLKASGVSRVILVGHSFDFPRTRNEFEAAGISVIPAPINIPSSETMTFGDFVPSVGGLQRSYFATYELLANALYHLTK
jgi:uncharacterized SAM-binding protein YcdF (DUF218 family)